MTKTKCDVAYRELMEMYEKHKDAETLDDLKALAHETTRIGNMVCDLCGSGSAEMEFLSFSMWEILKEIGRRRARRAMQK